MKHTIFTDVLLALVFTCQVHAESASVPPGASTPLDPQGKTVLMADDAEGAERLSHFRPSEFTRLWSNGWLKSSQILAWEVSSPDDANYEVELNSTGIPAVALSVTVDGKPAVSQTMQIESAAWNRNLLGIVHLKRGKSRLSLQLPQDLPGAGSLRSLDLLPASARKDYEKRVIAARSDASWMREGKYGVMLQYGGWTYPEHGPRKPWEDVVNAFDTEKFAKMVDEDMGAKWVIWSITWRDSHFPMPLKSVDAIVPGHTTRRDLIADLAASLDKRGIKLMCYYHPGHEDKSWWAANWQDAHHKERFIKNWTAVVSEIGIRYGDQLAGWFFDDGSVYSPAPFEAMGKAAKAGFPGRLITYNNSHFPAVTDFQDIQMGEHCLWNDQTAIGSNGIYQAGRHRGMQAHGMETINSAEWGVWQPEIKTPLTMSAAQAIAGIRQANKRGQVVSLNFDIYQDGTVTPETLAMMRQVKAAVRTPAPLSEGKPATVSGEWPGGYGADKAVDGDPGTFWAFAKGETAAWLEVDLGKPVKASRAVVCEGLAALRVPLVSKFTIEAQQAGGSWKVVAGGVDIGAEKVLSFASVTARKFRLHVLESKDAAGTSPVITEFQIFAQ